jgi:hypothetical protein
MASRSACSAVGQHGVDHVFDLVEGHVAHQVLAGRHGGEVLLEVVGHDLRIDVAFFELHRRAVLQVQAHAMEHRGAGAQVEPGGHVGRGGDALHLDHVAAVVVPALADFAGDVGNLQQRGLRLVFRHEAPDAGHAHDAALLHQLAQRTVHRHARHAELGHQLVFGRQAVSGRPRAVLDLAGDVVLDLRVEGQGGKVAFHAGFIRSCSWGHCCSGRLCSGCCRSGRVNRPSGTALRECPPLRSSFISRRAVPDALFTWARSG